MSPHVYASAVADEQAGASLDHLLNELERIHDRITAWRTSYAAAMAYAEKQPSAIASPLTVQEAADVLGCGRTKVYELIRTGRVGRLNELGRLTRIPRADVMRLVQTKES